MGARVGGVKGKRARKEGAGGQGQLLASPEQQLCLEEKGAEGEQEQREVLEETSTEQARRRTTSKQRAGSSPSALSQWCDSSESAERQQSAGGATAVSQWCDSSDPVVRQQ